MKKIISLITLVILFCSMDGAGCQKLFPDDPNSEHFSFYYKIRGEWDPRLRMKAAGSYTDYICYDTIGQNVRVLIFFDDFKYLYFWVDRMPKVGTTYQIPQSDTVFLGILDSWKHYLPIPEEGRYGYAIPHKGTFKFRTIKQDPTPPYTLTIGLEGDFWIEEVEIRDAKKSSTFQNCAGSLHHTQDPTQPPYLYGYKPYKGVYRYPHLIDSVIRR